MFLLLISVIINISFSIECINVNGSSSSLSGGNGLSTVYCPSSEYVMTSCGIQSSTGTHDGSWMSNVDSSCNAYENWNSGKWVKAHARCCKLTQQVICSNYISNDKTDNTVNSLITSSCPINEYLTGCSAKSYWGYIDGCYPSNINDLHNNIFNTYSLLTSQDCNAQNGQNDGGVWAQAQCCKYTDPTYSLECGRVWGEISGTNNGDLSIATCPSTHFLSGCSGYSSSGGSTQSWYISNDECISQKKNSGTTGTYAIAICCKEIITSGQTDLPTNEPSKHPTSAPTPIDISYQYTNGEYNLIYPYPQSYYGDGTEYADEIYSNNDNLPYMTHPNYEERIIMTFVNMARLYPNYFRDSKYGFSNTYGDYADHGDCGKSFTSTKPLFYNIKMNEAARFHQWDIENCDEWSAYTATHDTCNDPDRCILFSDNNNDCSFNSRRLAFEYMEPDDTTTINMEHVCPMDGGCYQSTSGHCSTLFDSLSSYNVFSVGTFPSDTLNYAYTLLSGTNDNPNEYPIVYGSHMDDRYFYNLPSQDATTKNYSIGFLLEYYNENDPADTVYLLYKGSAHQMNLIVGDSYSGFYEIIFDLGGYYDYFTLNEPECEPYSFIVETIGNNEYRLPENTNYYFGTALTRQTYEGRFYNECSENHYYFNGVKWKQNRGPISIDGFGANDLNKRKNCIGCSKVDLLIALE